MYSTHTFTLLRYTPTHICTLEYEHCRAVPAPPPLLWHICIIHLCIHTSENEHHTAVPIPPPPPLWYRRTYMNYIRTYCRTALSAPLLWCKHAYMYVLTYVPAYVHTMGVDIGQHHLPLRLVGSFICSACKTPVYP